LTRKTYKKQVDVYRFNEGMGQKPKKKDKRKEQRVTGPRLNSLRSFSSKNLTGQAGIRGKVAFDWIKKMDLFSLLSAISVIKMILRLSR
jgi:hypothetical protein